MTTTAPPLSPGMIGDTEPNDGICDVGLGAAGGGFTTMGVLAESACFTASFGFSGSFGVSTSAVAADVVGCASGSGSATAAAFSSTFLALATGGCSSSMRVTYAFTAGAAVVEDVSAGAPAAFFGAVCFLAAAFFGGAGRRATQRAGTCVPS